MFKAREQRFVPANPQFPPCHFNGPSRGRAASSPVPISPCLLPVVAFSNFTHVHTVTYIHICHKSDIQTDAGKYPSEWSHHETPHTHTNIQQLNKSILSFFLQPFITSGCSLFPARLVKQLSSKVPHIRGRSLLGNDLTPQHLIKVWIPPFFNVCEDLSCAWPQLAKENLHLCFSFFCCCIFQASGGDGKTKKHTSNILAGCGSPRLLFLWSL